MFRLEVDTEINLIFLQESLAEDLFGLIDSDREYLNKWLPWPSHTKTIEDSKSFIKNSIIKFAEGKSMICAIEYVGKIVGVVGYNSIVKEVKKVEIGYWISSQYQGKGIITRSCSRLIRYAFDELEFEKVQISVATENVASRKVCERLGLKLEGVIKNSENLHGNIVDHAIYGICASET